MMETDSYLSSVKKALGLKAVLVGKHVQEAGKQEPWFSHWSLPQIYTTLKYLPKQKEQREEHD